jgi:tetratricopeptide (TPR) repeat protein
MGQGIDLAISTTKFHNLNSAGARMIRSRWITSLALFAGLLSASGSTAQDRAQQQQAAPKRTPLSPEALFRRLSRSVFLVEVLDSDGKPTATASAVAIAPDRLVTNAHVVKAGDSIRIYRGEKVSGEVRVLAIDEKRDLALLRVVGLAAQPVAVRRSETIAIGQRVYAIGNPEGLELTFSEGIISGVRKTEERTLLQTTAPISPGSSGGGLFDAEGKLVGITTAYLAKGQNLNFAIPAEAVLELASSDHRSSCSDSLNDPEKSPTKSIEICLAEVKRSPKSGEAWFNLGSAYDNAAADAYNKSNFRQSWWKSGGHAAIDAFKKSAQVDYAWACRSYQTIAGLLFIDDPEQAIMAQRGVASACLDKEQRSDAHWNIASHFEELGKYKEAADELRQAVALGSDGYRAYLGEILRYNGALDEAFVQCSEAARLLNDEESHLCLGHIYRDRSDWNGAIQEYEKSRDSGGSSWWPDYWIGRVLEQQKNFQGATSAYWQATNQFEKRHYSEKNSRIRTMSGYYDPSDFPAGNAPLEVLDIYAALGRVLEKQGDAESALEKLRTAYQLDPENPGISREYQRLLKKVQSREDPPR